MKDLNIKSLHKRLQAIEQSKSKIMRRIEGGGSGWKEILSFSNSIQSFLTKLIIIHIRFNFFSFYYVGYEGKRPFE